MMKKTAFLFFLAILFGLGGSTTFAISHVGDSCATASDIAIAGGAGHGGYTIQACNPGATIVGTGTASYGNHYQRGRNDPFPVPDADLSSGAYTDSITSSATTTRATSANPGHTNFIAVGNTNSGNWMTYSDFDLRGASGDTKANGRSGTNYTERQGPCPVGYHIPSAGERGGALVARYRESYRYADYYSGQGYPQGLMAQPTYGLPQTNPDAFYSVAWDFADYLFLPAEGYRNGSDGMVVRREKNMAYWSSTSICTIPYPNSFNLWGFVARVDGNGQDGHNIGINSQQRANGYSLRCFKDEATPLTITGTQLTLTKEYDGTTDIALIATGTIVENFQSPNDEVSLLITSLSYDTANVGTNKTITVQYALTGADANKYDLLTTSGIRMGEITSAPVVNPPSGGSSGGGGGGGSTLSKDNCPNGDFSSSYYDGECGTKPIDNGGTGQALSDDGKSANEESASQTENTSVIPTDEILTAYERAYKNHITTLIPLELANPDGPVLRAELAKMVSVFATTFLDMQVNTGKNCSLFTKSIAEYQGTDLYDFMFQACQLNLMGIESDGTTPLKDFMPMKYVSRAEFGTVLSRMLYGHTYEKIAEDRWTDHLNHLKEEGIMKDITDPEQRQELRQRVRLMLMRSGEK